MGGINAHPFIMKIDRPFIFMVRDNVTNAVLFSGVVMNPAASD